jgi:hypothetical protein
VRHAIPWVPRRGRVAKRRQTGTDRLPPKGTDERPGPAAVRRCGGR